MEIQISKKDIIWSYIAQFFSMASGLIVLPLLLHKLSVQEVGMNYLMLTIGTLVSLFDFGFSPQFSRSITYVLSGAKILRKEGLNSNDLGEEINYSLLAVIIDTAKYIYMRLSLIVLAVMLTFGTTYIYYVTKGFTNVENSLVIWIIYSISVYFNVYYIYYSSLLTGAALIKESKEAMIFSRLAYIIIAYSLLLCNIGLLSVVIANLISPFVSRFYSYIKFYTPELQGKLKGIIVEKREVTEAISILWTNAKKLGINFIGSYGITKSSMFIAGLYLTLCEIGSLGLMLQFNSIVIALSQSLFSTYISKFNKHRVQGDSKLLIEEFSFTMIVFYVLYIIGSLCIILFGNKILSFFSSNTMLPDTFTLVLFSIIMLLEQTHSNCGTMIVTKNEIPFVKSGLISGGIIVILTFIILKYTNMGIMGIVLVQGLVQLAYNNWKWPRVVMSDFGLSYFAFLAVGIDSSRRKLCQLLHFTNSN